MEQGQHYAATPSLPSLFSSSALRQRLQPGLALGSWRNWLKQAIRKHGFPAGVRIGDRAVAWREDEVLAWLESRPRGGRFDGRRRRSCAEPGPAEL
jgi:hypothetical protein